MARIRVFLVLALAVTAGSAFAYGTYRFMQQAPERAEAMPTRPVLVATSRLGVGAELRPEDVRIVDWPAGSVPETSFDNAQEAVGRGVVLPIVPNEPILSEKLSKPGEGAGLPPVIPPGMRALSVRVNDVVGVAGYVLPGTQVDVVATVNPTQQHTDVTSKVILTNVKVLAAGTKMERDTENDKPIAVSVVTLLVGPTEAERLTLASTEGKIQLALRNPLDTTAPSTPGIRPAALMASAVPRARVAPRPRAAAARPAPPPEPLPAVEVIRGDERAQVVVRQAVEVTGQ